MDCTMVGHLIHQLRTAQGLTQKAVANRLNISDKTISKWESGRGCPDLSLLSGLSDVLGADILKLLNGDLNPDKADVGDIRLTRFYVCPACGNILTSTGKASVFCCGRKLNPLIPKQQNFNHIIALSVVANDYYLTIGHEMKKTHYIAFIAYVGDDRILLYRLHPEQEAAIRIPMMPPEGNLYAYCTQHGLWIQKLQG
jgi:DNA-binding XRE family transcriptional regulator/desulfoferrodoxin (superoxide reductase-like protein)